MIETAAIEFGHMLNSLGWAILHSIWQCSLAAVLVVLFRALTRDNQATLRYTFELFMLLSCLAVFLITFVLFLSAPAGAASQIDSHSAFTAISTIFNDHSLQNGALSKDALSANLNPFAPILGLLWCFGFFALAVQYAGAFAITQRLRRKGLSGVPAQWGRRFDTLVLNSGIRRHVSFYISNRITSPMTLGFFKPIVLVPASFFSGLPSEQMEAILLHEIAHIRRHDYLINLFQTVIRTVFFYHPAVYFISKLIDDDREHACDDFAVARTKNPKALARALVSLRLGTSQNKFTLAADNGKTPLLARLNRLGYGKTSRRRPEHALASVGTLLLAAAVIPVTNTYADAQPAMNTHINAGTDHPLIKSENYRFEKILKNNREFTVKIAANGTRWININGSWYDIDKSPQKIQMLPAKPQPPQPLQNDLSAKANNQFRIDTAYYEARVAFEAASKPKKLSDLPQAPLPIYDAGKVDAHMRSLRQKREAAFIRTHQSRETMGKAFTQVSNPSLKPPGKSETLDMSTRWTPQKLSRPSNVNEGQLRLDTHLSRSQKLHNDAQSQNDGHDYKQFSQQVLEQLRKDNLISSSAQAATITYPNWDMVVDGKPVPDHLQDNYCGFLTAYNIRKRRDARIEVSQGSFTYSLDKDLSYKAISNDFQKVVTINSASVWSIPAHVKPVITYDFDDKLEQIKVQKEASNAFSPLGYTASRESSIGQRKAHLSPR